MGQVWCFRFRFYGRQSFPITSYSQSIKIQSPDLTMWIQKIIFLTFFLNTVFALSERDRLLIGCKENTVQAEEQKLRKYLFDDNYDISSPPCANKTTIEMMIYPKSIEFVRIFFSPKNCILYEYFILIYNYYIFIPERDDKHTWTPLSNSDCKYNYNYLIKLLN